MPGRIRGTEMFLGRIAKALPASLARARAVADPVEVFGTAAAKPAPSVPFETIPMQLEGVRRDQPNVN